MAKNNETFYGKFPPQAEGKSGNASELDAA